MISDIKFAFRVLAKAPGFTLAAVAVLALGIGLNTAMFNLIYALAFSPRPLPAPERLVQLYTQDTKEPKRFRAFSHAAFSALRERPDLFNGVLAQRLELVAVGEGTGAQRALSAVVSANFFDVLGRPIVQGRGFTAGEETPGADLPVAVVSHAYWRKAGLRPDLLGSSLRINGRPFTIIGIAPENFHGTAVMLGPDLYFPLGVFDSLSGKPSREAGHSLTRTNDFSLFLTARLADGVSTSAIKSALTGIAVGIAQKDPANYENQTIIPGTLPRAFPSAAPPDEEGAMRVMGVVMLGLTGAVLLIVSLNLAGLFLIRGHARRKEFAIRVALGGSRVRLIRQLLTEGLLLSVLGGALGCFCAMWSTDLLIGAVAQHLPVEIFLTLRAPWAMTGATAGFCVLATLFFALGPALQLSRRELLPDLQQNAGEDVVTHRQRWLPRHPLVVAQIALSLALVIGAGLFTRMTQSAIAADAGIDTNRTMVVEFDASLAGYDRGGTLQIFRTVQERLAALPGLQSVSIAVSTPYSMNGNNRSVRRAGVHPAPDSHPSTAQEGLAFEVPYNAVGADYFATLGQPLLRGRAFTRFETDHFGAPSVAIIDEALAALLWPGEEAVGRHLAWARHGTANSADASAAEAIEVVGIARAAKLELFENKATGAIYLPFAQGFEGNVHLLLRTARTGDTALAALREPIRHELQTAANVPFFKIRTFNEHKSDSLEVWLLNRASLIATTFGAVAALIAIIGLYGAKAYSVARRTREIGIRLALGAEPARLRHLILREGLTSGLIGIGLGLLLGAALGRLLGSAIPDFNGLDPVVFSVAGVALFTAALAASWLPARQATKVNPIVALRTE